MAAYAIINNNVIVNVIEWDGITVFDAGKNNIVAALDKLPQGAAFPPTQIDQPTDIQLLQQNVAAIKVKVGA